MWLMKPKKSLPEGEDYNLLLYCCVFFIVFPLVSLMFEKVMCHLLLERTAMVTQYLTIKIIKGGKRDSNCT